MVRRSQSHAARPGPRASSEEACMGQGWPWLQARHIHSGEQAPSAAPGALKALCLLLLWLPNPSPARAQVLQDADPLKVGKGGTTFQNTWEAESVTRMRVSSAREPPLTPSGISSQVCHP